MVDNWLPGFDIETQIKTLPEKKVEEHLEQIINDIGNRKHYLSKSSIPVRALSSVIGRMLKFDTLSQGFIVNEKCNQCGICSQLCPAKNIEINDKVNFYNHCEGCLACTHHCPQNAIRLKNEKSSKRWRNPDVSLKEIIDANNRGNI